MNNRFQGKTRFIGKNPEKSLKELIGNTKIGKDADTNVAFGYQAISKFKTNVKGFNIALGYESGFNLTTSQFNIAIGYQCLFEDTIGTRNIAIGYKCLKNLRSTDPEEDGFGNIAIGSECGLNATTAKENVLIGTKCVESGVLTGKQNIGIGHQVLKNLSTGSENLAVGYIAGIAITTGSLNLLIGGKSGSGLEDGTQNVSVGANSMGACGTGPVGNVGLGYYSIYGCSGNYNTAIGYQAGSFRGETTFMEGNGNVLIGYKTGHNITSGSYNVCIGYQVNPVSTTDNSQLIIGINGTGTGDDITWIQGDSSGTITIGKLICDDVAIDDLITESVPTGSASPGTLRFNTSDNRLYIYDGSGWHYSKVFT